MNDPPNIDRPAHVFFRPSVFGQTGRQITISLSAFILTLNPRRQNYSLYLGPTDGKIKWTAGANDGPGKKERERERERERTLT